MDDDKGTRFHDPVVIRVSDSMKKPPRGPGCFRSQSLSCLEGLGVVYADYRSGGTQEKGYAYPSYPCLSKQTTASGTNLDIDFVSPRVSTNSINQDWDTDVDLLSLDSRVNDVFPPIYAKQRGILGNKRLLSPQRPWQWCPGNEGSLVSKSLSCPSVTYMRRSPTLLSPMQAFPRRRPRLNDGGDTSPQSNALPVTDQRSGGQQEQLTITRLKTHEQQLDSTTETTAGQSVVKETDQSPAAPSASTNCDKKGSVEKSTAERPKNFARSKCLQWLNSLDEDP